MFGCDRHVHELGSGVQGVTGDRICEQVESRVPARSLRDKSVPIARSDRLHFCERAMSLNQMSLAELRQRLLTHGEEAPRAWTKSQLKLRLIEIEGEAAMQPQTKEASPLRQMEVNITTRQPAARRTYKSS